MNIQTVKNVSDCVPLYLPHSLYLKPHAKMSISVQMPATVAGKSISNWEIMESLRNIILPNTFSTLKVTKSTLELCRLDAELDDRERLKEVLTRLDGNSIRLNGYSEPARVRASEQKDNFPKRHDWDSYFRDARNMDEKKPGERPDTIHISNLPIRWFCPRHMENEENVKPSESIFRRIFEKFGSVRVVDIPICDLYRKDMKSHMTGMKTFSFDQELYFEGYVQFSEYIGFVRAMDALRGMKLLHKEGDKNLAISIAVDFDTTKHLTEANIKRRQLIRDRLIMKENEKREEERRKEEEEEKRKESEREKVEQTKIEAYEKQRQREEKRKEKHLKKIREQEQQQLTSKIRSEEKKLLIAQRKLESIRVLEALFDRIKLKNETLKKKIKKEREVSSSKDKHSSSTSKKPNPFDLRNKLITKVKSASEQELERQKSRLKKYKSGIILSRGSKERSPSINSISSDDSILSDNPSSKKKRKKVDQSDLSYEEDDRDEKHAPLMPGMGTYPMYNPETGQWLGMYPYPGPFFPPMYPPAAMQYPNSYSEMGSRGSYRGRFPRSRGYRRGYRGRVNHYGHDDRRGDDWNDHKRRHRRRSGSDSRDSRSRSRSRSRSNSSYDHKRRHRKRSGSDSRSRSRSRSYSRNRRNRKSRSRSRSRSRTKLQEEHKSKKLASTLRRSRSRSTSSSSRASRRSRPQSRHRRSYSREKNSATRSKPNKSTVSNSDRKKRHETRTPSPQNRTAERKRTRSPSKKRSPSPPRKQSKSRSKSVDSSAFQSPKRKAPSVTPEKEWD